MPRRGTSPTFVSYGLILAGLALTLFALLADRLGVGDGDGFGYYQMIFLIGGIVLLVAGIGMITQSIFPSGTGDGFERED